MLFKAHTAYLTSSQIIKEIPVIADLLRSAGIENVVVSKGWGWRLSIEELWKPIAETPSGLVDFVATHSANGEFVPGGSDLTIGDCIGSVRFLLCHESDIHLETDIESLYHDTQEHWANNGILGVLQEDGTVRGADGRIPYKDHIDHGFCVADIARWREQELDGGRPNSLEDFYRARGLCLDCSGHGSKMAGWSSPKSAEESESAKRLGSDELPFYRICSTCNGSGESAPEE